MASDKPDLGAADAQPGSQAIVSRPDRPTDDGYASDALNLERQSAEARSRRENTISLLYGSCLA